MDVLKEVKEAEKQAADIEREFHAKADAMIASIPAVLKQERERREAKLASELTSVREAGAKEKTRAREAVRTQAAAEASRVEAQAKANTAAAVKTLLSALEA